MATVTSYTAARMQEIEDNAVVGGHITGDNLILERHDGTEFTAGDVRGPAGPTGPAGSVSGGLGSNDNRVLRTDGTGGTLAQGSDVTIEDSGRLTASLMSVTTAPSVGNDVVNKTYADKAGKGVLLYARNTTDTGLSIGGWVSIAGLSGTITPEVGRYYRFCTDMLFYGPIGAGPISISYGIFKSTDLSNPVVRANGIITPKSGTPMFTTVVIDQILLIPAGWGVSTTFLTRAYIDDFADAKGSLAPASFTIEDVGAP